MRYAAVLITLAVVGCAETTTEPKTAYVDVEGTWSQIGSLDRSMPVDFGVEQAANGALDGCGRSFSTTPAFEGGTATGQVHPDSTVSLTIRTTERQSDLIWNGQEEVEIHWTDIRIWEIGAEVVGNLISGTATRTRIVDYDDFPPDTATEFTGRPVSYQRESALAGTLCGSGQH